MTEDEKRLKFLRKWTENMKRSLAPVSMGCDGLLELIEIGERSQARARTLESEVKRLEGEWEYSRQCAQENSDLMREAEAKADTPRAALERVKDWLVDSEVSPAARIKRSVIVIDKALADKPEDDL